MKKNNLEVDVSPDMGMYRILPQQGYDPAFALAEFVDNAIHAYLNENSKSTLKNLSVTLNFYTNGYEKDKSKQNSIEIIDNGPGMLKSDLARAFKPAKKPVVEGLSEFGIGMKAASVWFTDTWELMTKNSREEEYHTVNFNLPELLAVGKNKILVGDSDEYSIKHGTEVCLKGLRPRRQFDKEKAESICQTLAEIYQKYTDTNNEIGILKLSASIDGGHPKKLTYKPHEDNAILVSEVNKFVTRGGVKKYYAIGSEKRWYKDINFEYTYEGVKVNVKGYIYILKEARYGSKNQGLIYFRNGRVIIGTHGNVNKPDKLYGLNNKYRSQRLFGELTIDGLPVTYTKDGIDFDEDSFMERLLEDEEVVLFCQQCENHRVDIEQDKIIKIKSEDEIPSIKTSKTKKKKPTKKKKVTKKKPKAKTKREKLYDYINQLSESQVTTLGIGQFLEELRYQMIAERPISAALSLRVVLEKGLLERISLDFNSKYSQVESMGVQALINYMVNNKNDFFSPGEEKVFKCAQANSKSRQYKDILLLNSVGHGGFDPQMSEIESMISNLQPLLDWAYKL